MEDTVVREAGPADEAWHRRLANGRPVASADNASTRSLDLIFRRLPPDETDAGYGVLMDVCQWLQEKRIQQWLRPLPREVYDKRQERGENCGLWVDGRLESIVSLVRGVLEYWYPEIARHDAMWPGTLACRRHGEGLGARTTRQAMAWLRDQKEPEVYLDCRPGRLDRLYLSLGFTAVTTKTLVFGEAKLDATLMRAALFGRSVRTRGNGDAATRGQTIDIGTRAGWCECESARGRGGAHAEARRRGALTTTVWST